MFPHPQADEATSAHVVAASVVAMSAGRLGATAAAAAGLIGILLGGRALARSAGCSYSAPRTGMVLGLIAIVLGGAVIATSDGGPGTGNGLGGAVVAIVAGLIATILGLLARTRGRCQGRLRSATLDSWPDAPAIVAAHARIAALI